MFDFCSVWVFCSDHKKNMYFYHDEFNNTQQQKQNRYVQVQCCFTSTETIRTVTDQETRTATSTFTQLLSSHKTGAKRLCFIRGNTKTSLHWTECEECQNRCSALEQDAALCNFSWHGHGMARCCVWWVYFREWLDWQADLWWVYFVVNGLSVKPMCDGCTFGNDLIGRLRCDGCTLWWMTFDWQAEVWWVYFVVNDFWLPCRCVMGVLCGEWLLTDKTMHATGVLCGEWLDWQADVWWVYSVINDLVMSALCGEWLDWLTNQCAWWVGMAQFWETSQKDEYILWEITLDWHDDVSDGCTLWWMTFDWQADVCDGCTLCGVTFDWQAGVCDDGSTLW